jgi:hypothetical protein
MTTVIELLQTSGLLLVALLGRGALVLAAVMVLSVPIMLFAYSVRAAEAFCERRGLPHTHRTL